MSKAELLTFAGQFSFEALSSRKLRAILTIAMVFIGATLVTSLNGMSQGMNEAVKNQLKGLGPNVIMVVPTPRPLQANFASAAAPMTFNDQTALRIRSFQDVRDVVPAFRARVTVSAGGGMSQSATLYALDQSKIDLVSPSVAIEAGRLVSPIDSLGIVLGSKVAYPPGQLQPLAKVGQTVTLEYSRVETVGGQQKTIVEHRTFAVRGILSPIGDENADAAVYVSPSAGNALLKRSGKYDLLFVISSDPSANVEIEKTILHRFGVDNIGVLTPKSIAERTLSIVGGFSTFTLAIAIVSLVVGAIGITTTLFTSVMERTREIGVLKALGFTNRLVLMVFLAESVAIGLLGGIAGIAVGSLAADLFVRRMPMMRGVGPENVHAALTPQDLLLTLLLSIGVSMAAGIYPAWRASRLDPVVALRKE